VTTGGLLRGYDVSVRSSSITRVAGGIYVGMLLIMAVLVLTTGLRVEAFAPAIVYGAALVGVGVLLLSPARRDR